MKNLRTLFAVVILTGFLASLPLTAVLAADAAPGQETQAKKHHGGHKAHKKHMHKKAAAHAKKEAAVAAPAAETQNK